MINLYDFIKILFSSQLHMIEFDYVRDVPNDDKKVFGNYFFPVLPYEESVFVDCGTSKGNLYKYVRKLYKNYYGIEAAYTNFKEMSSLVSEEINHHVYNKACYSEDNKILQISHIKGTEVLKKGFTANNNSLYYNDMIGQKHSSWEKPLEKDDIISHDVESISIDGIYKLVNKKINVLKVDIENAEYDFLVNKDISKVDFILIEISKASKNFNSKKRGKLIKYIQNFFNIVYTDEKDYTFINKKLNKEDFEFVNKNTTKFI